MATQAQKQKLTRVDLREDLARGYAPLLEGQRRVDRERGIIFGVKIAGLESKNRHGMQTKGTKYKPGAFSKAVKLYEGAKVNVNHPDKAQPNKDRSSYDRFGKFQNVTIHKGEPYGDLHYLKSHPLAPMVTEAAEREEMADCFALSHNARGDGRIEDGFFVVHEIFEVRSVDIVADGGTCRSLFESQEPMNNKTLRVVIAESRKIPAKLKTALLEMDDAMLDAPAPAPEADKDWKQHLSDAIGKLVSSDKPEDHDMAKKILGMLKPESAKSDSGSADTKEGEGGEDKDKKADDYKESRELETLKRFKAVTVLCESKQFQPTASQRKALEALESDGDREALIKDLQGLKPAKPSGPRSSPPGKLLTESAGAGVEVKDFDAWKKMAALPN